MKIHKKQIGEKTIRAYNDSGVEWVVSGGCDCGLKCSMCSMRFKKNKFTMIHAMEFYAQICSGSVSG